MRMIAGGILVLLCPMIAAAQQAAPTRPITFRITVPFSVTKLHPEITSVQAVCRLFKPPANGNPGWELLTPDQQAKVTNSTPSTRLPDDQKGWQTNQVALRDLPVTPTGTYSGNLILHVGAMVPVAYQDQPGSYECGLQGCRDVISANPQFPGTQYDCDYLRNALRTPDDDPRLLIASPTSPTGRPVVKGTFTW